MADFGSIAIGTRIGRHVDASFFHCWTGLLRSTVMRPGDVVLNPAVGVPHCVGCCIIASHFLATPCDALLFLDDDMEFWANQVATLRSDDHGFDVLSCLYVTRKGSHSPLVLAGDPKDGRPTRVPTEQIKGVVPVKYVGFGGLLVKRWVIAAVVEKYNGQSPFWFDQALGEDGRFSVDAAEAGAKIAVNCDVRFGHRVEMALSWNVDKHRLDFAENDFGMTGVLNGNKQEK